MFLTELLGNLRGLRLNDQVSTLRHCISSVQAEIGKDLLNLGRISQNDQGLLRERKSQLDRRSHHATEKTDRFRSEFIEVEVPRLQHLSPGEGQQLSSKAR